MEDNNVVPKLTMEDNNVASKLSMEENNFAPKFMIDENNVAGIVLLKIKLTAEGGGNITKKITIPSTKSFSALPLQDQTQSHYHLYHCICKTKHKAILSFTIARPITNPFSILSLQDQAQNHSQLYLCKFSLSISNAGT